MKKLLLVLSVSLSTYVGAQNTAIPDANFEQALIDLGYDSAPLDRLVPTANIVRVTGLDISGRGIEDLTGIEAFTNLTTLNCSNNQLRSLNLNQNVALQVVDCSSNQLSFLAARSSSVLERLDCSQNELTGVDLSQNSSLMFLSCFNNRLTRLDLSENNNLLEILCFGNQLTELNLRNGNNTSIVSFDSTDNPNLACIEVDDVTYSLANWPAKDASTDYRTNCDDNVTYIPDDNFEQALIDLGYDNTGLDDYVPTANIDNLDILDVSNNGISDFTGIEAFTALTRLECANNLLTSLNLRNNVNLTHVNAPANRLNSVDFTRNPALRLLNITNNRLTSIDVSQNPDLATFRCSQNQLTSLAVDSNDNLSSLACSQNLLTELDLSSNGNLASFDASDNQLEKLNIDNGNNSNITSFQTVGNPRLECITVSDVSYAQTNFTEIDAVTRFSNDCSAAVTFVPDDVFEQALINLGYDMGIPDDYVPTTNITGITILDISNQGITDLTGIEDFVALRTLNCAINALTELDLSSNTALTSLVCHSNVLQMLDLAQNTNLETLDCSVNQLTELDVRVNVALETLACIENKLVALDLSNNDALTELYCSSNQLTTLDVRNGNNTNMTVFRTFDNPNLECINIDDLVYASENFTDIDTTSRFSEDCSIPLGPQTFVPDDNFEQALIDLGLDDILNDYVTTANIENVGTLDIPAKGISDLAGIEDFTALVTLNLFRNSLTTLSLTENENLRFLTCSSNQLTSIDISQNIALEVLNVNSNQLTDLDVSNNTALIELQANGNQLSTMDLSFNSVLESLWLDANQLSALDIGQNSALVSLSCRQNQLTTIDLDQNTILQTLNISANRLTALDISQNPDLNFLNCNDNELTALDLGQNTALESCYANNNQLSVLEVDANSVLRTLWFAGNLLTEMDASQNPMLENVNAGNNQLESFDIRNGNNSNITLFDADDNPNLLCISVSDVVFATANWTNIDAQTIFSEDCDTALARTFVPDDNFEQALIDLGYDSGPPDDYVPTVNIDQITELDVSDQNISDLTGIEDFSALLTLNCGLNRLTSVDLSQNVNLEVINCRDNQLTALDVSQNGNLTSLVCEFNEISALNLSQNPLLSILEAQVNQMSTLDLSQNNALTHIDVADNQLTSFNIQNGNNNAITIFYSDGNPDLFCIQVDDVNHFTSTSLDSGVDPQTTFSVDCNDTTPPIITLNGDNPQEIELGAGYTELGATTDDGSQVVIDATEFVDAVGSYTIYYNATDAAGNAAAEVTRTVNVVMTDATPPLITLIGANPQEIELGAGYTELGATTDDGSEVIIDASEFVDAVGSYTIYYNATDTAGNAAVEVTRTVNVVETDTTAPVITLIGANPQEIELGAGYTELGATTDDGSQVVIDATEFVDAVGSYTIYYNATDAAGNAAAEVTRTVNVVETDTTAQVITLIGANPQEIELGAGYTELGATTDDGSQVVIDASEFVDAVGSYTIYYNATDAAGNAAAEVT
ncbi:DUF5011 domain-containing protein, partial [Flavobacteriaceae bacterium TP-CH-4]